MSNAKKETQMDSINIKILKCLSRNARINASEIA
ncbi:MAG: winged helix-turn-helix transcriptional regulator [Clostridia bacterium]